MKRTILLTLAAGVATLPALWGVTGNTTFGQSVPAAIPSGASVAPGADDSRTPTPTAATTADGRGGSGSEATTSTTVDDKGSGTESGDDSGGHGGNSGNGGSGKG